MSAAPVWDESTRLVDLLLEEDRRPTAVDEFSSYHDGLAHDASSYEALLPTSAPGDGEQYAFRVDLDACTGCKACVTACHGLNGLDEGEQWRRVGLLDSEVVPLEQARPQTITGACHHCAEPGCLAGCPVRAYEKDAVTGVVHHLDDQCIGCRYCQLMCPYDVPQYSERLGIVRKCDMCRGRLAEGEAPACVQGCPNGAISIAVVDRAPADMPATILDVATGAMPLSTITRPTTRYVSAKAERVAERASVPTDLASVRPGASHTPLAIMLVLTQAAIGATFFDAVGVTLGYDLRAAAVATLVATLLGGAGLAASTLHLGRPQFAFRAILGLRTSWMSREIVALGGYSTLLVASAGLAAAQAFAPASWIAEMSAFVGLRGPLAWSAVAAGALGLTCSTMLYAVTGRPLWRLDRTTIRFVGTSTSLGLAIGLVALSLAADPATTGLARASLAGALVVVTGLRLVAERDRLFVSDAASESIALERSRMLLAGTLAPIRSGRRSAAMLGGVVLPVGLALLALVAPSNLASGVALAVLVLLATLCAEFCERALFFRAEAMPTMPGAMTGGTA